jgi:hypothetical protein
LYRRAVARERELLDRLRSMKSEVRARIEAEYCIMQSRVDTCCILLSIIDLPTFMCIGFISLVCDFWFVLLCYVFYRTK